MTQAQYVSTADAETYFDDVYGTAPASWTAASSTAKTRALKRATRWLDITFGARWAGTITTTAQDLGVDWPRSGNDTDGESFDSTLTPEAVKQACAEAAALDLAGTLDSVPDRLDSTARIASKAIAAGSVSKSVTYVGGAPETATAGRRFPKIEGILRKVLSGDDSVPMQVAL